MGQATHLWPETVEESPSILVTQEERLKAPRCLDCLVESRETCRPPLVRNAPVHYHISHSWLGEGQTSSPYEKFRRRLKRGMPPHHTQEQKLHSSRL